MRLSLLLAACVSSVARADFNLDIAAGIISSLTLELKLPWMTVDFDSELCDSGFALIENDTIINADMAQRALFSGIRASGPAVFMHYIGTQTAGMFYGYYGNGTSGPGYLAENSGSNESCHAMGFDKAGAIANRPDLVELWKQQLCDECGGPYYPGGHCLEGHTIDQETGITISTGWYDPIYYDPRIRPWYTTAVQARKRAWSPIYVFANPGFPVGITAARPLYSPRTGELLGVAGLDFVMDSVEVILSSFVSDNNTIVYLLDGTSSLMVASSIAGIATNADGQVDVTSCANADVKATALYVLDYDDQEDTAVQVFNEEWWVQNQWFRETNGLEWRVITMQKISCPGGFAIDRDSTNGACFACAAGSFAGEDDLDCTVCPAGTSAPNPGSVECTPCAAGSFQMISEGISVCALCAPPLTSLERSTECTRCVTDFYFEGDQGTCAKCPRGAVCEYAAASLSTLPGYWRTSNESTVVYTCPYEENCVAGSGGGDALCAEGSGGILCSSCMADYFHGYDGACVQCNGGAIVGGFILCIALLGILVGLLMYLNHLIKKEQPGDGITTAMMTPSFLDNSTESKRSINTLINAVPTCKILWSTMQIVTSVEWELEVVYPQPFAGFLGFLSFVKLSFGNDSKLVPMGCLTGGYNFLDSLLVTTLAPILLVVLIMCIAKATNKIQQGKYAVVVLTFCVLVQTSTTIFRTFLCSEFDGTGTFLNADYSVSCDNARYDGMVVYAVMMIFVYPIGIPLAYFLILKAHKDQICPPGLGEGAAIMKRDTDSSLAPFRFLFKYYKPNYLYFEIFDSVRRILLGVTLGSMGRSSPMRAAVGIFIALIGAVIQREAMPYHDTPTGFLHYWAQWQIAFTFFCGMIITSRPFGYDESLLGTLLIFMNISTPAFAFGMHYTGYKQRALATHAKELGFSGKDSATTGNGGAKVNPIESAASDGSA